MDCPDDDGPRILRKGVECLGRGCGVRCLADGNRMALRAKAFDFVESKIWSGCDYKIIVIDKCAVVKLDPLFARMDALAPTEVKRIFFFSNTGGR